MPAAGVPGSGIGNVYGQIGQGSATGTASGLPANTTTPSLNTVATKATQGWYITGGIVVAVMLGNTKAGPFLLGILGVALIYQVNLLIQGK